ncbi:MAG: peptide synthase [Verrucomicrobia bacterium]|nr:MAG: peptide synthase [Verrucomicrobiota bacterium]
MSEGPPANVARYLPERAASQPDFPALLVPRGRLPDGSINYLCQSALELNAEADAWAFRFAAAGIERGTRVLLMVRPGLSLIGICFALFKVGAVPIVIDPGMGLPGFLRCVQRSKPRALVGIGTAVVLSRVFFLRFRSVGIRLRVRSDRRIGNSADQLPYPVAPTSARDLAAVLFTSGSTGPAKGVCYEHGMFEAQVSAIRETYSIEPGEIDLPMLPIFALFNPALGMTTVVPEINPSRPATVDPSMIVQAIRQCSVTSSFGSPVLWKKIADHCIKTGSTLPTLRRILMAGAPVPPRLMQDFREIIPNGHTHTPYGATEVLPVSSIDDETVIGETAERTQSGAGTCVGRPLRGVEVRVIEPSPLPIESIDEAIVCAPDHTGEIIATGPTVTRSYDQLPEATAQAKIRDGDRIWHRMGDLGYLDSDGRLWFCGRQAEAVRTADGVFYTDCCEAIFNPHPGVRRTALIAWQDRGTTVPAIVIELVRGRMTETDRGKKRLVDELAALGRMHRPTASIRHFFFHKQFPVDVRHNAKINRLKLAGVFKGRRPILSPPCAGGNDFQ